MLDKSTMRSCKRGGDKPKMRFVLAFLRTLFGIIAHWESGNTQDGKENGNCFFLREIAQRRAQRRLHIDIVHCFLRDAFIITHCNSQC